MPDPGSGSTKAPIRQSERERLTLSLSAPHDDDENSTDLGTARCPKVPDDPRPLAILAPRRARLPSEPSLCRRQPGRPTRGRRPEELPDPGEARDGPPPRRAVCLQSDRPEYRRRQEGEQVVDGVLGQSGALSLSRKALHRKSLTFRIRATDCGTATSFHGQEIVDTNSHGRGRESLAPANHDNAILRRATPAAFCEIPSRHEAASARPSRMIAMEERPLLRGGCDERRKWSSRSRTRECSAIAVIDSLQPAALLQLYRA